MESQVCWRATVVSDGACFSSKTCETILVILSGELNRWTQVFPAKPARKENSWNCAKVTCKKFTNLIFFLDVSTLHTYSLSGPRKRDRKHFVVVHLSVCSWASAGVSCSIGFFSQLKHANEEAAAHKHWAKGSVPRHQEPFPLASVRAEIRKLWSLLVGRAGLGCCHPCT